jgi:predicted dehydrogenase
MDIKALVIGYGSIGRRHAEILDSISDFSCVEVMSSQTKLPFKTIKELDEIPKINPDYVVIASSSSLHREQLAFLDKNLNGRTILVEKPLFDNYYDLNAKNNRVFVGYNLRFHPLIQKVREIISGRQLWNIQAFCGSYLPDWRPDRDYRETSSAKKDAGGGVLLDHSHELDYIQWLVGPIHVEYVVNQKISNLRINTDDILLLSGKSDDGARIHVSLNYFTRKPIRQLLIDGEEVSIQADLIKNTLSVVVEREVLDYSWEKLERNSMYEAQHLAALEGSRTTICSYEEGLKTMQLIEKIRSLCKL